MGGCRERGRAWGGGGGATGRSATNKGGGGVWGERSGAVCGRLGRRIVEGVKTGLVGQKGRVKRCRKKKRSGYFI